MSLIIRNFTAELTGHPHIVKFPLMRPSISSSVRATL